MCHRNWHTFLNKSYSTFLKKWFKQRKHVLSKTRNKNKLTKLNGQVYIQIRLIPVMRYFKWDTKSRRLAALRDLQYYSEWEGPQTYKLIKSYNFGERRTIWKSRYRTIGPAVLFKLGRTANLIKLQSRDEGNHMKIRISHYRTCTKISFNCRMGQELTQV